MRLNSSTTNAASAIAIGVAFLSAPSNAQSTGTVDFENDIVVTGTIARDIAGLELPATSKAKQVLNSEYIQRQIPGQTILDTINTIPGVSFTNNDAYGSAGGQLTIRGFSQDRISLTFDGIPVNDSGNYQIYSSQQLDPELIEEVNVNLGTTDVDSPTAAASGSTVNYRTRDPSEDFGAVLSGSAGEDKFFRIFGVIDTGAIGSLGTRAFLAASHSENDNPYNNYGRIQKDQYNAKIYQPIGSNGDFVSIAGHYSESRNNFFGSLPLRLDATRVVGPNSSNRFPRSKDERFYLINYPCQVDVPQGGVADAIAPAPPNQASCGTEFDRRYNPSDTGNIRLASRFSLADNLVLTVDPSYQWVSANGGGTANAQEGALRDINPVGGTASTADCRTTPNSATNTCVAGYLGGTPYFGRDINGDGDILDTVVVLAPNQTRTRRIGVIAGLRWEFSENHAVRLNYTFDRARHRQTGEVGLLKPNGEPFSVFPFNDDPQADAAGVILEKRDRLSFAILHQVSAEYRGQFLDDALTVTAGVRAPFFKRDLNNFCFTTSETGFVECFGRDDPRNGTFGTLNPTVQGPQQRVLKYDDILPNLGAVFQVTPDVSVFGNYSKGLQVPSTDSLYNAFFFAPDTTSARPEPETTDNFDLGLRFRSGKLQAQGSVWYTKYKNRLAAAYDPETDKNLFRNLGSVDKYGIDGSIAWQVLPELSLYAFGSWMKSKILDNVQAGLCTQAQVTAGQLGCTAVGQPAFYATKGKRESGAPAYTFGGSARATVGAFELGVIAKRTGGRFLYDTNEPLILGGSQVYPAKTNSYWLVNLDARVSLEAIGLNDRTYLQFNVYNLFDALYVGNFTSGITPAASAPNAQIGAPRTISGTVVFAF